MDFTGKAALITGAASGMGAATARAITSRPRDDVYFIYPGESISWTIPFPGGSHEFLDNGVLTLDGRIFMHFYATGITPAMAMKMVGIGSQYACAYLDATGQPFDGSKTYKIHLPSNVPAKDFWSFTLYDNQTRSMLQTDQQFPGIDSNKPGLQQNSDGSYDIYFGPTPPAGKENNWLQTIPGYIDWQASRAGEHTVAQTEAPVQRRLGGVAPVAEALQHRHGR